MAQPVQIPVNKPVRGMGKRKLLVSYLALIGVPVLLLLAVLAIGKEFHAPHFVADGAVNGAQNPPGANVSLLLLVGQIVAIIFTSRLVGYAFRAIGQPQVVGEMLAGILLGPSFLGWLAPNLSATLFPDSSLGQLGGISQLGLILFMFLVGLELNPKELYEHGEATILISHVSIVAPFVLGSLLSLYLYPRLSDDSVSFMSFTLFMGAAMSITAFPVLARILAARRMSRTRLGTIAIGCAAVDDVSGWCILAGIVALIRSTQSAAPVWMTLAGLAVFLVVMILGVRPALSRLERSYRRRGHLSDDLLSATLLLAFAGAFMTQALGLHLLFGAFVAGAVMPKETRFVAYLTEKFETVTVLFLLPLFFAFTGLRTRIGLVEGAQMWFYCALIVAVAVTGKMGGTSIAAR